MNIEIRTWRHRFDELLAATREEEERYGSAVVIDGLVETIVAGELGATTLMEQYKAIMSEIIKLDLD